MPLDQLKAKFEQLRHMMEADAVMRVVANRTAEDTSGQYICQLFLEIIGFLVLLLVRMNKEWTRQLSELNEESERLRRALRDSQEKLAKLHTNISDVIM